MSWDPHQITVYTIAYGDIFFDYPVYRQVMTDVADISDGAHFNVPGGSTVAEYSQELLDVFEEIASARPLKLVY